MTYMHWVGCFLVEAIVVGAFVGLLRARRRQAESALQESAAGYRVVFETSPVAMYLFDPQTVRFTGANSAALRLYGYARDEFLTLSLADIKLPNELPLARASLRIDTTKDFSSTVHQVKRDGTLIKVDVVSREIVFQGEKRRLVVAIDRSVHEELEAQLRQAQKMEAVGQLAGGVAHDFNNMLSVILGFTWALLEDTPRSDPAYESLVEIKRAAERSADLTKQLLAFSRQQPQSVNVVDLNDIVASTNVLVRKLVGEHIGISTNLAPMACKTEVDAAQVEQIIMNLVVNARDAMPDGGKLTIDTDFVQHEGRLHVMLAISDTGTGIDHATQARMFEPFFTTK